MALRAAVVQRSDGTSSGSSSRTPDSTTAATYGSPNTAPFSPMSTPKFPVLRPAGSSSTLASFIESNRKVKSSTSRSSLVSCATNATTVSYSRTETMFSSLKYSGKDELGKGNIIDAQTGAQLKRHKGLWFDDGSVVFRAENTLFCVHMSLLERHSECFKDMFSIPQPEAEMSDSIVIEGSTMRRSAQRIPVITLFDKEDDVANLLKALYDIGPDFGNNDEDDFRAVSGILRLATKYIIDELREMALAHVSVAWPSTLKGWDLREDLARSYEIETALPAAHRYPHPFAIINLAREVDAPSLLPAAFYDLSRYSFSQIFEPHEEDPLYRPPLNTPPPLSQVDLSRLCIGKEHTSQMITTLIQAMGSGQHMHMRGGQQALSMHQQQLGASGQYHLVRRSSSGTVCSSAAACKKDFAELVELATQHYLFDRERGCYDPLYVAEELGQLKSAEISECKACAKSLEAWAAREREKIWRLIPMWFRLEV